MHFPPTAVGKRLRATVSQTAILLSGVLLWAGAALAPAAHAQSFVTDFDNSNPVVTDNNSANYQGCAWIDFNNDGWLDLFVVDGRGSFLYENSAGTFTRVNHAMEDDTTFFRGTSWADYDNDGDLDCFLTGNGGALYRNDGGGTFVKLPYADLGTSDLSGWSPAWGDYDEDGDLDMVITFPFGFVVGPARANRFLVNEGPGTYTFMPLDTGVITENTEPYTSGNWSDYDLDGDLDYFVGAGPAGGGSGAPDFLYRNRLVESGAPGFELIQTSPIATDLADGQVWNWIDYDNDGDLDAYRTNWGGGNPALRPNDLYRNDNGTYVAVTGQTIVTDADISLSQLWEDFDNDGDLDCFVANDVGFNNKFYRNNGDGTFTSVLAGDVGTTGGHQGATAGDYDNDGDVDIYSHGANSRALFINTDLGFFSWFQLELEGVRSNRSAVGARIHVKATINGSPVWQMREISTQNAFLGHSSLRVHFGLRDATIIDSLRVVWPSGVVFDTTNVAVDQLLSLTEVCPDTDGDGIGCTDNCPDDANAGQADADGDGIGDACDTCPNDPDNDIDNDGICGDVDACPLDPDNDIDGDGLCAGDDNCPEVANPDQSDVDGDGQGDACDVCPNDAANDADGDGVCGDVDNCPDLANADQADADGDNVGDLCDNCPDRANADQADSDNDGIGDACESCCIDITGNVDGDAGEVVDVGDLTALINFLFVGSITELPCEAEANIDGDPSGTVDVGDLTALINFLFIGTLESPADCL